MESVSLILCKWARIEHVELRVVSRVVNMWFMWFMSFRCVGMTTDNFLLLQVSCPSCLSPCCPTSVTAPCFCTTSGYWTTGSPCWRWEGRGCTRWRGRCPPCWAGAAMGWRGREQAARWCGLSKRPARTPTSSVCSYSAWGSPSSPWCTATAGCCTPSSRWVDSANQTTSVWSPVLPYILDSQE